MALCPGEGGGAHGARPGPGVSSPLAAPHPGRLLIVGNADGTNVGHSLLRAARELGIEVELKDSRQANGKSPWLRRLWWHLGGHRQPRLRAFARELVSDVERLGAGTLITTGHCPVTAEALVALGRAGVHRVHYSTDDPWNPAQRARWALRALRHYDAIFTTRRANLVDFRALGCRTVRYLPFGYDPALFHPEARSAEELTEHRSRLLFVGGADGDRVRRIEALSAAGVPVTLYGDYWTRYPATRDRTRGHALPEVIRRATAAADVCLCLVRRANRDGHVMRSLEIPAVGACMLVEDTDEHRELFGEDGETVHYFDSSSSMVDRARGLLSAPRERARLAHAVHGRITSGRHTYRDRLATMLSPLPRTG